MQVYTMGIDSVIYANIYKRVAVFSQSFFLIVHIQASEAVQKWHSVKGRNVGDGSKPWATSLH